jgi:hypothetical protein
MKINKMRPETIKMTDEHCWVRDLVNLMMMIRSFLASIICVFNYFEEVLKDSYSKSS